VADLCRRLREARERAGLSIQEISARTKISVAALHALELGQFDRLPGDFYTRAFLKTYAREVHLSAEDIVREYDEITAPPEPAIPAGRVSPRVTAQQNPDETIDLRDAREILPVPRSLIVRIPRDSNVWAGAVLVGLVAVGAALAFRPGTHARRAEPGTVATAGVAELPAPAGTSGRNPPPADKLTIDIQPTAPIWVAATADGNSVIYRLLKPGEHVIVDAQRELSFRIGNAGAFIYAINGVPGKLLGGPDEVREFEITRDNYLTYRR